MNIKQITAKQADRWLEKLKGQNPQSFKNLSKFLRTYEKNEDQYDCYVKINHTLLAHSQLTKEINNYMEEPNKFIINKPEAQRIKDFMAHIKKHRSDAFEKIIQLIQELGKAKGEDPYEISQSLRPRLNQIARGDPDLQRIIEEALDLSGEELIKRKNLDHLKVPKTAAAIVEDEKEVSKPQSKQTEKDKKGFESATENYARQPGGRFNRPLLIGPFTNPSEEKSLIRQIEKTVEQKLFNYIMKVIQVYYLNIITRNEAFQLLAGVQVDQLYMQCLRDILDSRETERRKASNFKPLEDINFNNVQRASPSYVAIPQYYPIRSSGKPEWIKALMNQIWVSVPQGSEQSQNFSVRNKNSNQINLLKAEDQRYEFDMYMGKLQKVLKLLDEAIDEKNPLNQVDRQAIVKKIISMGIVQSIYRQAHRDQKEEFQWFLKISEIQTCKIVRQRVKFQVTELTTIKNVHAFKNWTEIAAKNFFKALDLKGFQFKKNEKEKMKSLFFISELQERMKLLQNGGQFKKNSTFQEKKDFFTVLNSFECSSRTQRCKNRQIPQIQSFDLTDNRNRHLYPVIVLSFEDTYICQNLYSLLLFYISAFPMGQTQKTRCRLFLEHFFIKFLGWRIPARESLNENFDQEKFYQKINGSEEMVNLQQWITQQKEELLLIVGQKDGEKKQEKEQKKRFGYHRDVTSNYSYLPAKNEEKSILYGSENLYTFVRFVYAAYERLIKMKEVAESRQKIELFKILFYSCVKTKESSKFQENLNLLFGKNAYLFSTLYKLFDSLVKNLSNISGCPLMNQSLRIYGQESEDIYFVLLNRFCLTSGLNNSKLVRLTFNTQSKAAYFNYIDSYYKSEESGKDMVKRRAEIAKGIQIYTIDSLQLADKKRRKPNQVFINSEVQYIFQGSTIKMLNHKQNQDLLFFGGKKTANLKLNKRELKRAHRFMQNLN